MADKKNQRLYLMLFLAAFAIAMAFRFIHLEQPALNDMEASLALEALAVAEDGTPNFSGHIAYVGLTSMSFFIFNAGNFLARFWPALFGALIVFIPFLFRGSIGRVPAIMLAFVLAISPEMVGLSRMIGSPMMALIFLIFAIAFYDRQKPILMGAAVAMGLMSGPGFWLGGFIMTISFLLSYQNLMRADAFTLKPIADQRKFWFQSGLAFALTILLVGTCFLMAPAGLTGVFSGIIELVQDFGRGHLQPYRLIPLALITYMAPALFLGLWGGVRGVLLRSYKDIFLLTWFLVGLSLILVLPGRGPADLLWVSLPLWTLSMRFLSKVWQTWRFSKKVTIFTAILTIVSMAFIILSLRSLVNFAPADGNWLNALFAFFAGVALITAILLLVRFGWSHEIALSGFMTGAVLVIVAILISTSVNSTGINPNPHFEMWYPEEAYQTPEWLIKTIEGVNDWNARRSSSIDIAVVDADTPAMQWILRDQDPVSFVPYLPPQTQVGMIISDNQTIPAIAETYRGQDLVISRTVPWRELTTRQYFTWWMTREVPTVANEIIFWVRTNLMPNAQFSP